ncbi:phage tail protein [Paenibacillus sp. IB182496]|uniref:Phage tail protein n=1 Tax=Paenibacillus sabuli TaxID=2772509 RepID=A0A927GQL8_9BACL|nr:tail fiber protein [Paenibacillus sabuli]MBD2843902.1 phage tail protein [Paenibacillus sabuli]
MSDQYVGEIRMFSGNYAPQGWAFCDGSLLSINENEVLYALLGTVYGGDGRTNFALPDLRGRVPIHIGEDYAMGQKAGSETVTLLSTQLPKHTHTANANQSAKTTNSPENAFWGQSTNVTNYQEAAEPNVQMNTAAVSTVGANQAHDNMMPSLAVSFIIAKQGVFPSQG